MTTIQNISFEDLKGKYQTPLYIYDEAAIRHQCKVFINKFRHPKVSSNVIYASKAFLTIAMAQLVMSEGLHLDCVSQGELYTALKAGFPVEKIVLHGNNKTKDELLMALNFRVGTIIVDNDYEASILNEIVNDKDIVTHMPPKIFRFTHVGNILYIGRHSGLGLINSHKSEGILQSLEEIQLENIEK